MYLCVLLGYDQLNENVSTLGVEQMCLNMQGYWDFSAWWKLYRFARERQIDLIHSYGLQAHIIGRIVGKMLGIPVNISSVQSTDPWRKWYHSLVDFMTSGLTDLYISNSEAGRLTTHQRERIPLSKVITIPSSIDCSHYEPYHSRRESLALSCKQALGIPETAPVIGIIANIRVMKGHKLIVDAFPHIQRQHPELKCLFVGHDCMNGEIQQYIKERHLEQEILCTGFRRDIPEILSAIDIFLLPSSWEGFPTSLLEAMAMKKPVIASNVGGIPELVEHNTTGILIPPQDADALANAVNFLLDHTDIALKMGQTGYERVKAHFSLSDVMAEFDAVYDQLIKEKSR